VAGISVKVKVHYPGRSHFAHESGTGFFSRFEKSAEGIVGHINQWLKARTLVLIGVDSLKSVRRGKRRNEDLTVRGILMDTVPWAVLEADQNAELAPLSLEEEHLFEPTSLLERMVERENMMKAYKQVVKNKGSAGIDGMPVDDLKAFLQAEWADIKMELLSGSYKPKPVKRVEIPKPGGGRRKLGVPTVLDRLIQQALHQVLEPIFDPTFSENSYGFRRGRSAHQAIGAFKAHVESGKSWVVDVDLEKFFDRVDHQILLSRLRRKVKDERVLKLINRYLKAGVLVDGDYQPSREGTPQGGPLSPLLSNVMLDDLDKELEKRGHQFARYADDLRVFVGSRKSGERVLSSLEKYLRERLKLKVNPEKSQVVRGCHSTFLGYSLTAGRSAKLRVPKASLKKIRDKLRAHFRSGRGRNLGNFIKETLKKTIKGWINYFKLAEVKSFAKDLDGWVRRRLRNIKWRQWKGSWTRKRELMRRGLSEERAVRSSFNQRGPWWNSGASHMNQAFPKSYFDKLGLVSMLDELMKFKMKLRNRRDT
jgi:RNA-directed DNA polymerase